VLPSGRTAYEEIKGREYSGEVVEFGEAVFARDPAPATAAAKMDARWHTRIWLGKVEASDEHLVAEANTNSVSKVRSIRRKPQQQRWSKVLLEAVKCTPWTEGGKLATAAATLRRRHITAAQIREHGPTGGCAGCCGDSQIHNAPCRERFAAIWKSGEEAAAQAGPEPPGPRSAVGVAAAKAKAAAPDSEPQQEEEEPPGEEAPGVGEDVTLEEEPTQPNDVSAPAAAGDEGMVAEEELLGDPLDTGAGRVLEHAGPFHG
jgi:hypothetical protein